MAEASAALRERIARYPAVALVLQGGGALGAYQCGVYQALNEAGIRPNWYAGISIGAINAAIIAGNPPERRVERLREFWETVCEPAGLASLPATAVRSAIVAAPAASPALETWAAAMSALAALWQGQRGFFQPWPFSPFLFGDGSAQATSFYDTTPLLATLARLVDFDRINDDREARLTVGVTDVASGNFRYFDSRETRIGPEHIMASAALPPAFAPVEIEGRLYWDGGIVSNTPLEHILDEWPREDTLAFQVDLWSARGAAPRTMMDVLERAKDIQFSSRTRHGTDTVARTQRLRTALNELIELLPEQRLPDELQDTLGPWLDDRVVNIIHLIYQAQPHEQQFKDYAFGMIPMNTHWQSGLDDTRRTLAHPHWFDLPDRDLGYAVHDVHRKQQKTPRRRP
ncbi:patatin-like phospholipase family protein [Luteimonas sp. e5]